MGCGASRYPGYSRQASRQATPTRQGRAMPDPATILLVDDNEPVQKLLAYPLERDGYRVVQARDGEEALKRFDELEVDLVVLDLMLPKLDGLEVCKRVRAVLRRAAAPRHERATETIDADGLRLDPARRSVELGGMPVQLTYVEFE